MSIPHPIPYQGSKRNLAGTIVRYFPETTNRLIEPFVGSAAVSLHAAYYQKAKQFVLNDINEPLICLWDAIINHPDKLARRYSRLWRLQQGQEREFYDLVRAQFNKARHPHYLLYLLARCVKASVRYNANGEFNQSPDNRRKGRHPDAMGLDIHSASVLLSNKTRLLSQDYTEVLKFTTPDDVVYMDPPYQGVSASRDPRYLQSVGFESFADTLDDLNSRSISYIVSYDGKTGDKTFGRLLPSYLNLALIEIDAGRSSQATLLGRHDTTIESLYLSPALMLRLDGHRASPQHTKPHQLPLFSEPA